MAVELDSVWDHLEDNGDNYFNLPLGAHILKINSVSEYRKGENVSLKVDFDIYDENENRECFLKEYERQNMSERRWPNEGTKYFSLKPNSLIFLKRFVNALEKSNGITLDIKSGEKLNLEQFSDLLIGGNYGLEEYEKDGEIETRLILNGFKSIDELDNLKAPQVKLINNKGYMDYETYKHIKNMTMPNYKLDENNNIIEDDSNESLLDDDQEYPF